MASSLYLDILNLTVGPNGNTTDGFAASEMFLLIQGRKDSGDGQYAHFDWASGALEAMSLADNTVSVDSLGVDPNLTYAPYWISLADLLKKDYYDPQRGVPIPTPFYSGRVYVSFGNPVYIRVVNSDQGVVSPAEPDEANTADPNYATVWDKFEFTADTHNVLFSNTTCVDFVGIPFAFSVNGSNTPTQGFALDQNAAADPFAWVCRNFQADPDFKNLAGVTRLFAPKVNSENFAPFGKSATYLDPYIDYCWAHYRQDTAPIELWNFVDVKAADFPSQLKTDEEGKSCQWIAHGAMTAGVLAFTVTKLIAKNKTELTPLPANRFTIPHPNSWDTLRQGGVFAPDDTLPNDSYLHAIDGDIKNQVSTALNRNVMHGEYAGAFDANDPAKGSIRWADRDKFYADNDVPAASLRINKYGKFLHDISIGKLCYALAYDDKYSQNVNLSVAGLNPSSPTVMKLMVYYKKSAAAGLKLPAASMEAKDFLGGKYTVRVSPDPQDSEQVVISLTAEDNATAITNCNLMYPRIPADAGSFNKYFPAATKDNSVKMRPASFANAFQFAFRFQIAGDTAPNRQYLLPQNAAAGHGQVFSYDYTKTAPPQILALVEIPNV